MLQARGRSYKLRMGYTATLLAPFCRERRTKICPFSPGLSPAPAAQHAPLIESENMGRSARSSAGLFRPEATAPLLPATLPDLITRDKAAAERAWPPVQRSAPLHCIERRRPVLPPVHRMAN